MLNRVQGADFSPVRMNSQVKSNASKVQNNATNVISFNGNQNQVSASKIAAAYRGYNNINLASTVSFTGSFQMAFDELNQSMITCKDIAHGKEGEEVGKRVDVSRLLSKFKEDLPRYDDAIKTTIEVDVQKNDSKKTTGVTDARVQVKKGSGNNMKFEMVVRPPRFPNEKMHRSDVVQQIIDFQLAPYGIKLDSSNRRSIEGTEETAYVLNTKGKLMAVVEDDKNVLLTNTGFIEKLHPEEGGRLTVSAKQYEFKDEKGNKIDNKTLMKATSIKGIADGEDKKIVAKENKYKAFKIKNVPIVRERTGGSEGGGTEIAIGLEDGRFVPEIIDSIDTFCKKVEKGEIVLDKFVPAKDAQGVQIAMLAGGFGSRAEYANASSSKIMHGKPDGSNLTKGCFRTATGLTPMETTFISLHKAGLLDCSKENLGIGKNIKFYLNDSGNNTGNGGFTIDMYDTMEREGRNSLLILPNDAMSRIPVALSKMTDKMNSGEAAVVMVAKEVDKEDARGSLGIMKINDKGEIEAFAEKPKEFAEGYVDSKGKCFANTFQFAVSKEAFEALKVVENYLPPVKLGKESRDWSKVLTPVLMGITQNDDVHAMQKQIKDSMEGVKEFKGKGYGNIPLPILQKAKSILGNQKIYAVKSNEPWADCGTLNALYHTTMQIASGDFPLEDFERKHAIDSVNTQTGLVASSPEQKAEIEQKYKVQGQVMAAPRAQAVSPDVIDKWAGAITRYSDVM